MKQKRTVINIV